MSPKSSIRTVQAELEAGIALTKCQQCGCMESTLKNLAVALPTINSTETSALTESVTASLNKMRPVKYSCLGCEYCYPAVSRILYSSSLKCLPQSCDQRWMYHSQSD